MRVLLTFLVFAVLCFSGVFATSSDKSELESTVSNTVGVSRLQAIIHAAAVAAAQAERKQRQRPRAEDLTVHPELKPHPPGYVEEVPNIDDKEVDRIARAIVKTIVTKNKKAVAAKEPNLLTPAEHKALEAMLKKADRLLSDYAKLEGKSTVKSFKGKKKGSKKGKSKKGKKKGSKKGKKKAAKKGKGKKSKRKSRKR